MPSEILRRGNAINIQPKILHAKCDKLTLSLHCLLAYRLNCVTFVCVCVDFFFCLFCAVIVLSTLIQLAFAGALDGAVGLALASLPEAVVLEEPLRCFVLLQDVLGRDRFENVLFGRFLDLAADEQLVQDEVSLFEVEDDVQLANTSKVFVQQFYVSVDDFQREQLVIVLFDCTTKV